MPNPILLLTRPKAQSLAFAARFPKEDIVISPLIEIEWLPGKLPLSDARGLIFTSRNGVDAFTRLLPNRELPAYCVGAATAQRASKAGFVTHTAGGDADALVAMLLTTPNIGPMIHIRGTHARGDVANRLTKGGVPTTETILYDQKRMPLNDPAKSALCRENPVIVPLFSPRSAAQFRRVHAGSAPIFAAAMSQAVAVELQGFRCEQCVVAPEPTADAMELTVSRLLDAARSG